GANDLQNFPVLTAVTAGAGSTTIAGTLNGAVNKTYTIQFFASAASGPTGYGEGQTYLGQTTAKTNSSGNLSFTATVPALPAGRSAVTATAPDPGGNTSEFSHGLSNIAPIARDDNYTVAQDNGLSVVQDQGVLVNDSDPVGFPLGAVLVTRPGHGTLS